MVTTTQQDRASGESALEHFYNEAVRLYPENMRISFDEFINLIDRKSSHYITGLGMGLLVAEVSYSQIEDSMEMLAQNSMGKVPQDLQNFTQAIINKTRDFDFNTFKNITSASFDDAIKATQEIGTDISEGVKGIGFLAKNSKYVIPAVGIFALYFFIKSNSISGIFGSVKKKSNPVKPSVKAKRKKIIQKNKLLELKERRLQRKYAKQRKLFKEQSKLFKQQDKEARAKIKLEKKSTVKIKTKKQKK